jgi:hypothetical protein
MESNRVLREIKRLELQIARRDIRVRPLAESGDPAS